MVKAADREGRRHALSLRVTGKTRSWIEQHASAEGRSITQEVEARLELQAMAEQAFGGPENYRLLLALAQLIPEIEEGVGSRWFDDNSGVCKLRLMKCLGNAMDWQSTMRAEPSEEERRQVSVELGLMPEPAQAAVEGDPSFSEETHPAPASTRRAKAKA